MASETSAVGAGEAWGRLGAAWGLGGVLAMLGYAIVRLAVVTSDALTLPLDWRHWALLAGNGAFMAFAEGYRGFQKAYSPRVVARARYLRDHPSLGRVLLAPLFCMGYFATRRRRLVSTYVLTAAIIALIVVFQHLRQPWRGVLDAGVVIGLTWGAASIVVFATRAFGECPLPHSPELPDDAPAAPPPGNP